MVRNKNGTTIIFSLFVITIVLIIIVFVVAIYFGITNSMIYNLKLDMYSINKSAIISMNKPSTSRGGYSYSEKDFRLYLEDLLKRNYNLDDNLENPNGFVKKVEIKEYTIIRKGKRDNVTKKICQDNTIHSLIKVQVKPLILEDVIKDSLIFEIHEDVVLNKLKM